MVRRKAEGWVRSHAVQIRKNYGFVLKQLLIIFYLLLQDSGFIFLVLPFCLQHSEKLGVSLVDCIRSLGDLHVLDDYLIFLDPVWKFMKSGP